MPSEYFNPADHLLDLVSVDSRKANHDVSQTRVEGLIEKWRGQAGKVDVEERVASRSEKEMNDKAQLGEKGIVREKKATGMVVALPVVLERHWKNLWRQKEVSLTDSVVINRDPGS